MSRYIDAEALLNKLPDDLPYKGSVKRVIMQAPTADVAEVKHGGWVYDEESAKWGFPFVCTAKGCGKAHDHKEKYCPNCGAKMDGKEAPDK